MTEQSPITVGVSREIRVLVDPSTAVTIHCPYINNDLRVCLMIRLLYDFK